MKNSSKKKIVNIYDKIIDISAKNPVHLHQPVLSKENKKYLNKCIDAGYISSDGK